MVTAEEILDQPGEGVRADAGDRAARQRTGRALPRRRRPGDRGRDRVGDPAVLRRLRPGAAHRRRSGAQLPVRARGVRPADAAARRAPPTRRSPTAGWPRWPPSVPVTASTTRRSSSPTGRCRPSAAESGLRQVGPGRPGASADGHDLAQEAARTEEVGELLAVVLARQPGLAAVRRVQPGVVPDQRPDGGLLAALGGAHEFAHAGVDAPGGRAGSAGQPRGKLSGTSGAVWHALGSCQRWSGPESVSEPVPPGSSRSAGCAVDQGKSVGFRSTGVGHHHRDVRAARAPPRSAGRGPR